PIGVLVLAHMLNLAVLLALTWRGRWTYVAPAAVIPAALALIDWQRVHDQPDNWWQLLALGSGMYAVFMTYPFVLGSRSRDHRDPVAASASVDHYRMGARRCGARVAISTHSASRSAVCGRGSARGCFRAARAESRDLSLRAARIASDSELVSLHLRRLRGGVL